MNESKKKNVVPYDRNWNVEKFAEPFSEHAAILQFKPEGPTSDQKRILQGHQYVNEIAIIAHPEMTTSRISISYVNVDVCIDSLMDGGSEG